MRTGEVDEHVHRSVARGVSRAGGGHGTCLSRLGKEPRDDGKLPDLFCVAQSFGRQHKFGRGTLSPVQFRNPHPKGKVFNRKLDNRYQNPEADAASVGNEYDGDEIVSGSFGNRKRFPFVVAGNSRFLPGAVH